MKTNPLYAVAGSAMHPEAGELLSESGINFFTDKPAAMAKAAEIEAALQDIEDNRDEWNEDHSQDEDDWVAEDYKDETPTWWGVWLTHSDEATVLEYLENGDEGDLDLQLIGGTAESGALWDLFR